MAEKRNSKSRQSIVQGLQEIFQIDRSIVKAVLESENWNVEKCLKMLQSLSPKFADNNNKRNTNKNKKNNSQSVAGKSGGSTLAGGNTGQRSRRRNKQLVSVVSENVTVTGSNSDPWVMVGVEKKVDKHKNQSKSFTPAFLPSQANAGPSKSDTNSKKKKREVLKNAYSIIRQKSNPVDRIKDCIKCEIKILVLMRGCPGSGKSTFARQILNQCGVKYVDEYIFSTDNFFLDSKGHYNYDRNRLDKAHTWNQDLVEKVMKMGLSPVIVDNTHVKAWEMMCYAQFAVRLGYVIETLEPPTPWFFNGHILAKKNSHGVPKSKITCMLESYEPSLSGNDLLKIFNIDYNLLLTPPQAVNYSEGDVLTVLNKAMAGKKLFTSVKKKSQSQNSGIDSINNLKIDKNKYPVFEIVQTEPSLTSNQPLTNFSRANIPTSVKTSNLKYGNSNLLTSESSVTSKLDCDQAMSSSKIWSVPYHTGPGSSYFPVTPMCVEPSTVSRSQSWLLQSHLNNELSSSDNSLIDKPLDGYLGDSLLNPLLPVSFGSNTESKNVPPINLDPSEFPSLSTSSSANKITCNAESNNSKSFEEKSKKITELFPHLDKEYITDLCVDSKRTLDDIVSLLLDSNSSATPAESAGLPEHFEDKTDEDSSSEEEIDETPNFTKEKDVGMLIQLFPNIKECKISETYEKFCNDFKVTLDFLLNYDPSETASEINESEETNSNAGEENVENPDDNNTELYPLSVLKLLKSLDDCGSNLDSALDFSNLRLKTEIVDSENDDTSTDNQTLSDNINYKLNNTVDCASDESCYHPDSNISTSNLDKDVLIKYNGNQVSTSSSQCRFICQLSDSTNQIIDSEHALPEHTATGKSEEVEPDMNKPITLDNFEVAMKNALTALSVNYASPRPTDSSDHFEDSEPPGPSKSLFTSKLVDWNFKDNALNKSVDKNLEDIPKSQRSRINFANVQTCSTNTNYKDFESLKKAENSESVEENVLSGNPFNFVCQVQPLKERIIQTVLTLDKGTSTSNSEEVIYSESSSTDAIGVLSAMFPNIPSNDLKSLLGSCINDLDWAVGLLLDDGHEISKNFNPSDHKIEEPLQSAVNTPPSENDPVDSQRTYRNGEPHSVSVPVKIKKSKIRTPVENINYVMNDESISSHVRRLRNSRLGIAEADRSYDMPPNVASSSGIISQYHTLSSGSSSENEEEENEETLAVALSTDFVLALQAQFGGYIPSVSPDNQVLVDLPVHLARQLHSCIMDSISQQLEQEQKLIDKMIADDECLARHLQEMENEEEDEEDKPLSIQEIMDQELALNIHKSMNKDKSKGDTVAGKLSRQLLIERFPSMDPIALQGILDDSDHSLHQATQLLEAAGYNRAVPSSHIDFDSDLVGESEDLSREDAVERANAYREAAKVFFKMRHECFAKAQQAYSKGDKRVASYYSEMANWHNERIEQAHHLASTLLMTGNQEATTIDLHFLRVREALQVLDLFLDAHVNNLREMKIQKRQLYIITGRGLHSHDGKSKIRPATMQRLKQRSIGRFCMPP